VTLLMTDVNKLRKFVLCMMILLRRSLTYKVCLAVTLLRRIGNIMTFSTHPNSNKKHDKSIII